MFTLSSLMDARLRAHWLSAPRSLCFLFSLIPRSIILSLPQESNVVEYARVERETVSTTSCAFHTYILFLFISITFRTFKTACILVTLAKSTYFQPNFHYFLFTYQRQAKSKTAGRAWRGGFSNLTLLASLGRPAGRGTRAGDCDLFVLYIVALT